MSSPARDITDHLRALYGADGGDAPGWLVTFLLPSKTTIPIRGDNLFGATPARIAELAETEDAYLGVGLQAQPPAKGKRGDAAGVLALPGLFFDLDEFGPNHVSTALPRTRDESLDFLSALPVEPSLVVDSGGGLQAHWLFHELAVFASSEERAAMATLSEGFQRAIIARGEERGWKLDNTADLARILRPAGTINHKQGQRRRVQTIYRSNARHTAAGLRDFAGSVIRLSTVETISQHPADGLPASGETMRTVIATAKARGQSNATITDVLDLRIRRYLDAVGNRGEGDRDNTAFRIARWLLNDFGANDDVAWAYLAEWNHANDPPLSTRELALKMRSAKPSGRRPAGCAHTDRRGSAA